MGGINSDIGYERKGESIVDQLKELAGGSLKFSDHYRPYVTFKAEVGYSEFKEELGDKKIEEISKKYGLLIEEPELERKALINPKPKNLNELQLVIIDYPHSEIIINENYEKSKEIFNDLAEYFVHRPSTKKIRK